MKCMVKVLLLQFSALVLASSSFGIEVAPYFNIENPPPAGPSGLWPTTGLMDAHIKAGLNNAMINFFGMGGGSDSLILIINILFGIISVIYLIVGFVILSIGKKTLDSSN